MDLNLPDVLQGVKSIADAGQSLVGFLRQVVLPYVDNKAAKHSLEEKISQYEENQA